MFIFFFLQGGSPVKLSSNIKISGNELKINTITHEDIGDYLCLARNDLGSITASSKVIIAGPASITNSPRNLTKLEGEKAEFRCESKALPSNITHKWFHNNVDIKSVTWLYDRVRIKSDGTLIINPTSAEDSGQFTCQVFNGIGLPESASAWLNVECKLNTIFFR